MMPYRLIFSISLGEPLRRGVLALRAALACSRRAIRSITFAHFSRTVAPWCDLVRSLMRSVVPLLSLSLFAPLVRAPYGRGYAGINANNGFR
jgi:hypothetical protein